MDELMNLQYLITAAVGDLEIEETIYHLDGLGKACFIEDHRAYIVTEVEKEKEEAECENEEIVKRGGLTPTWLHWGLAELLSAN